jgi:hypothetical protein
MSRLVVVVPLREGAHERARELLREGPPFDLAETRFDAHAVFVTHHEALFVFEGDDATLRLEAEDPALWGAARAWRPLLAGPPRVALLAFAWRRAALGDGVSWAATPGPGDSDGGDVYPPG